jgi:AI-2 transport protein TqsA
MPDEMARNRMLAVILAILVIAALRASYSVTMPLAVAAVIVAAIWPVKPWLDRVLPSSLSYAGTVLLLLIAFAAFIAAIYFSAAQVVTVFAHNRDRFGRLYEAVSDWADQWGFEGFRGREGFAALTGFAEGLLANGYTVLGYFGFIAVLVIFGLPEVQAMQKKLRSELDSRDRKEVVHAVEETAGKIRSYLGVTMVTSLMTGIGCAAIPLLVGLDLALVWGVLNFLLNFIPVVGNIIGIIPPTLYAFIQFQDWMMPTIVFVALSILQIGISNFVYPMLQGRSLSLSPLAILVALAFWSWLWGIAGALIAVPLTVAFIIVCERFPSTAWIAKLLSESASGERRR